MKTYLKRLALVAVVGMAGAGFIGADQFDKKTVITVDEALQLPNMTLQPGTYVIKLADSTSNRHIVRFFDKDEKHLITTILAIPNERLRATGKSVFAFWEMPAGQPRALRAWFYPGDDFGQEFTYPKDEAARISASNGGANVPTDDEKDRNATVASSAPAQNDSSSANANSAPAPAPASVATAEPAPARAPVDIAAAPEQASSSSSPAVTPDQPVKPASVDTSSDAQRVNQSTAPDTLPKTASNLPLLGLMGLLSIVAALALNWAYNRS